jgi:hypothetical protein
MTKFVNEVGEVYDTGDDIVGWLDKSKIMRGLYALSKQSHDDRLAVATYNPPSVLAPAIDQAQFDYDMNREVEMNVLANPSILAHRVVLQEQELEAMRERLDKLEHLLKEKSYGRTIIDP